MQSASNKEGTPDEGKNIPPVDNKTGMDEDDIATKEDSKQKLKESSMDKTLDLQVEDVDAGNKSGTSPEEIDKDSKTALATITKVLENVQKNYLMLHVDQYSGSFITMLYGSETIGETSVFKMKPAY